MSGAPGGRIHDLTVRVGCSLGYQVSGTAALLLNLKLAPSAFQEVIFESLTLGDDLKAREFRDSHGNDMSFVTLKPGSNFFRHDAIVSMSSQADNSGLTINAPEAPISLPPDVLRYALPSRFCDSDKLSDFAWKEFGHIEHGWPRIEAINRWIYENLEYRYFSGRSDLSAWDVVQRGYGVCRDFAHVAVALNRSFNLPTRYVTGHLPDIGFPSPPEHMDFHAYAEVYVGGAWFTLDPRFNAVRIGRIRVACGQDAVDGAFSTIFGGATLSYFQVWAYQVEPGSVSVGDPIDLDRRLDNVRDVRTTPHRWHPDLGFTSAQR